MLTSEQLFNCLRETVRDETGPLPFGTSDLVTPEGTQITIEVFATGPIELQTIDIRQKTASGKETQLIATSFGVGVAGQNERYSVALLEDIVQQVNTASPVRRDKGQ